MDKAELVLNMVQLEVWWQKKQANFRERFQADVFEDSFLSLAV